MNDYTRCREDCLSCLCKEILPGWCDARCSSCQGARECPCCSRKIREQLRRGEYRPFGRKETSSRLEQVEVSISQIAYPGPWQQRPVCQEMVRFMVADLTERGQRNPIKVRIRRGSHGRTIYELVNGEVRLRAAKALGWSSIRCVAKELDNWQAAAEYLLDNLAERKMPWEEVAKAILAVEEALVTKNGRPLDSRRLGKALGRSKDWINDHKRALRASRPTASPRELFPTTSSCALLGMVSRSPSKRRYSRALSTRNGPYSEFRRRYVGVRSETGERAWGHRPH